MVVTERRETRLPPLWLLTFAAIMDTFRTTLVFIILFLSKGESGQCNEGTTLTRGWGFNASSAWDHGPCGGEPEAAAYETVGRQLVVQGETRRLKSRVAVDFQPTWHVLGPLALTFLGSPADVLSAFVDDTEHYLSQRNLTDHFPSEIAEGGYAIWQALMANRTNPMAPWLLEASFPINADLLASFYGITGIEFGAIAVTEIRVPQAGIYRFSEPNAPRTFVVDGRMQRHDPFMGNDSFGYHLEAGKRLFWVPVTEYGNSISLRIPRLQIVDPTPAVLVLGDVLMPDIVGGKLTSPFWSMTIMPTTPLLPGDLRISGSLRYSLSKAPIAFDAKGSEGVAALQPWPLKMSVAVPEDVVISLCSEDQLLLQVYIRDTLAVSTSYRLRCRNFSEPYRFTFEDFDGSVQYAAMWSPRTKSCPKTGCAVLMSFHGAGVEADSYAWTSSYRQQEDAWILLPTNRRQYGYDWATTGAQNAWSALAWLGKYQPGVPLNLKAHVFADTTRILYAGHSMGGHGCLVASTHFPDFGLGLVPASGWLRHSTYLPDYLIPDFSHLDHVARGILENSIADTDADAHASNVVGLPALIRVGTVDETVPSQNLRRFFRILRSFSRLYKSTAEVTLSEIAGEGHWFGGLVSLQ